MKYFDYYKDGEYVASGTVLELSETLNIGAGTLRNYSKDIYVLSTTRRHKAFYVADKLQVYALYLNDEMAAMGTLDEIAAETGYSLSSLKWYSMPTGIKRSNGNIAVIKLEDEFVITRRTGVKYASKPVEEKWEPKTEEKTFIHKPVGMQEFKFKNKWINYQLKQMFRGWQT